MILPSFAIKWGGPVKVAYDICKGLQDQYNFTILCAFSDANDQLHEVPDRAEFISFQSHSGVSKVWRAYSWEMTQWLDVHLDRFDMVHIHEMWHFAQFSGAIKASRKKLPYVISPHGELDTWRLNHKRLKKQLFGFWFQKRILRMANAIHSLTPRETRAILHFGGSNLPVVEIHNSISLPYQPNKVDNMEGAKPYILFLGRLQEVKGCLELLQAFTKWRFRHQYDLVFAGTFETESYRDKLLFWVKENKLEENVHFTGLVQGEAKIRLLQGASVFVLASYSEGFPVAVLEAMQVKCPLIVSTETGIDEMLEANHAAVVVSPNPNSIKEGLDRFFEMPISERNKMALNAYSVFKDHYAVEKMLESYRQLYNSVISHSKSNRKMHMQPSNVL